MKLLILILCLFTLQACSSGQKLHGMAHADSDYIELPGREEAEVLSPSVPHTIFDEPEPPKVQAVAKPSEVQETKALEEFGSYTVMPDDNLGYIALQLLGRRDQWRQLLKWNPDILTNPSRISTGMVIKYQLEAKKSDPAPLQEGYAVYTVQKNDNLANIAQRLLGDKRQWKKLQEWNRELIKKPGLITKGMALKYQQNLEREPAEEREDSDPEVP